MENLFCDNNHLTNESDVESLFVDRLISDLSFPDEKVKRKHSIEQLAIGIGSRRENYKPDYVLYFGESPKIIIDAKSPTENIYDYTYQVSNYALRLNQRFEDNPVKFTILTNGLKFAIYEWDKENPLLELSFEDFNINNDKYNQLKGYIEYSEYEREIESDFVIKRPSVDELKIIFKNCHNLIWRKDNLVPADAFYEFTKLIFLKLNEDKKIHQKKLNGEIITKNDYQFSVDYIESQSSPNPINDYLFKNLLRELEEQIDNHEKKRIFESDEDIQLTPSTIKLVVEQLQYNDLYAIDEDVNGRMFEVFLSAIVRGKELGAYFTPRTIVECMVELANLQVKYVDDEVHVDKVLDGCCGSGGFLINSMSSMLTKLENNRALTHHYEEIKRKIQTQSIWGIEKNPATSRISRINMYVHGDGGSKIYCADGLDKDILIEEGLERNLKKELEELHNEFVNENIKFDVILTNPPFAMTYKSNEVHEKRILEQYGSLDNSKNISFKKGSSKLKSSVKSNVLFLARYLDLLVDGGKLLIVLDNSILNSITHKDYRDWLKNNFIIKAIISLPKYAFVQSGAGGATSILYLEKKSSIDQNQPFVFARSVSFTGFNESGKEIEENDLEDVVKEFKLFEETGELYLRGEDKIENYECDELFLINPEDLTERFDVSYHSPSYHKLLYELKNLKNEGIIELKTIDDFNSLQSVDKESNDGISFKYADIGVVDKERGSLQINECEEGTLDILPSRATLLVNENDVIFPAPFNSLGKVAIIPKEYDNNLVSNGFYGIKLDSFDEAFLMWNIIRSYYVQKQFLHVASGYTQMEITKTNLEKVLFPIPINKEEFIESAKSVLKDAVEYRKKELESYSTLKKYFEDSLEY